MIDFQQLKAANVPTPLPEPYPTHGLHWVGWDYVSPLLWVYTNLGKGKGGLEYGAGFFTGAEAQVAFAGGPLCYEKHGGQTSDDVCQATISAGVGPDARSYFQPLFAQMSAGWASDGIDQFVTVQAYSGGNLIGSRRYNLSNTAQLYKLVFPNWGPITELKFVPSPGGSVVMYILEIQ